MRILEILQGFPTPMAKEALFGHLLDTLGGLTAESKHTQKKVRSGLERRFHTAAYYLVCSGAIKPVREHSNVFYLVTPLGRVMPDALMRTWIDGFVEMEDPLVVPPPPDAIAFGIESTFDGSTFDGW